MTARTVAKHTGGEPDRLVPVTDTWARAARLTIPVPAIEGGIDWDDHLGMARRLVRSVADGRAATVEGRPDTLDEILGEFVTAVLAGEGLSG
ncbi:hypothetical protein [Streptomyces sp. NPDC058092]|uniref:hypothetical protein n=1 Tax=Streptomyces sp. NPDC058092 TaxID=3346336 RepID=UPI0036ED152A